MTRFQLQLLLLFASPLVPFSAAHADTFSCGGQIIAVGDDRASVLRFCGEPSDMFRAFAEEAVHLRQPGTLATVSRIQTVVIETWTLNFGPHSLMRRIVFHDGRIQRIETLGHGYETQVAPSGAQVHLGDSPNRVRAIWGDPVGTSSRVETTSHTVRPTPATQVDHSESTEVTVWTFDLGPGRLRRQVTFENGAVTRIDTLRRGH